MSAQHTPGNWRPGKPGGTVVSDQPLPNYTLNGGHDEVEHYGGYLIAESIWRAEDARLIAAAPALLEALEALLGMDVAYQRGTRVEAAVAVGRAAIAKAKGEQQ
ncbi:hypothetical protein B9P52_31995 [Achromobacter denitrificans]|uniref:hypothetical protein n=1 Tax=Achromobacter denitrificans TaxID=32002 RepID=UPI000B4C61DD|nr:hypothetical protein [Achromobacter denitrificans]ASC68619.1 hypothetical protein B9P52_31995 [Achromobacter denitrificans]